jgi:hypothetical protein
MVLVGDQHGRSVNLTFAQTLFLTDSSRERNKAANRSRIVKPALVESRPAHSGRVSGRPLIPRA